MTVPVFPSRPRVAVPCRAVLGEAPMWDARTATLFWVDIKSHLLFRWRPDEGSEPETHRLPEPVAFVKPTPDTDTLVLGLKSGVARYALAERRLVKVLTPEPEQPGNRLNDAGCGPDGSLYFGTMDDGEREPTGTFYHWCPAATAGGEPVLHRFGAHATVTNGPSVDSERRRLYTTDTSRGIVYVHDLTDGGPPGEGRVFVRFGEGDGHPDGLTIDAEHHVWIGHFGAARVTRFSPDGEAVLVVPMPTAQVTKVAFGGPDLATMYVTTAAKNRDPHLDPMAGHLFALEPGVRGLHSDLCRVGL